jgi:RNA polymerase sigma-70 factor, ECF subfamily
MHVQTDHTEQELLARLKTGDEAALRIIFNLHYKTMLGQAHRLIPDAGLSKDLVQEVFVEVWNKREDLNIHTSLVAYLRRAVVNRSLNHIKTQKRFILNEPDDWTHIADESPADIDLKMIREDRSIALHQAIEELPEKCRLVFNLSRFENLSHQEIADQLGISKKTIENQITKALKNLRKSLLEHPELSAIIILLLTGNN